MELANRLKAHASPTAVPWSSSFTSLDRRSLSGASPSPSVAGQSSSICMSGTKLEDTSFLFDEKSASSVERESLVNYVSEIGNVSTPGALSMDSLVTASALSSNSIPGMPSQATSGPWKFFGEGNEREEVDRREEVDKGDVDLCGNLSSRRGFRHESPETVQPRARFEPSVIDMSVFASRPKVVQKVDFKIASVLARSFI